MVIAPNVRYSAFFIAAQKAAQKARIGIWALAPESVLTIDLSSLSVSVLQVLQEKIMEELLKRSNTD